ncbi:MAG: FtsW/RodA/SpoVE family cell cycle protein [Fervidobacterium sp.]
MRSEIIVTIVCYMLLFVVGAIAMYSLDIAKEQVLGVSSNFFQKHIINISVSFIMFLVAMNIPFSFYEKHVTWLYALGIILLGLVFVFPPINGAHRWITVGSFTLQASEFTKIILILYLSIYVKNKENVMNTFWKGFAFPLMISLVYFVLIFFEPNLSTALLTLMIAVITLYYGGAKLIYFLLSLFAGIVGLVVASTFGFLHTYQLGRLRYFFGGATAPQVDIALRTMKNSGITGSGVGSGWLKVYVPEAESDFVLAVIGEDWGFFGIIFVLLAYLFLTYSLMRMARHIEDTALRVFTWGYATVILLHMTINLGVFAGFLPVTGVPLPFVSTGGSSMMALLTGFGIILSGLLNKGKGGVSNRANDVVGKEENAD